MSLLETIVLTLLQYPSSFFEVISELYTSFTSIYKIWYCGCFWSKRLLNNDLLSWCVNIFLSCFCQYPSLKIVFLGIGIEVWMCRAHISNLWGKMQIDVEIILWEYYHSISFVIRRDLLYNNRDKWKFELCSLIGEFAA